MHRRHAGRLKIRQCLHTVHEPPLVLFRESFGGKAIEKVCAYNSADGNIIGDLSFAHIKYLGGELDLEPLKRAKVFNMVVARTTRKEATLVFDRSVYIDTHFYIRPRTSLMTRNLPWLVKTK